jgi:hypothetical protein
VYGGEHFAIVDRLPRSDDRSGSRLCENFMPVQPPPEFRGLWRRGWQKIVEKLCSARRYRNSGRDMRAIRANNDSMALNLGGL